MKGRDNPVRGSACWKARLTERQVIALRSWYERGMTLKRLSKKYDIHLRTARAIIKRETWHHI